jgi:rsbT co-antagonist protein RsbR
MPDSNAALGAASAILADAEQLLRSGGETTLRELLATDREGILEAWLAAQLTMPGHRSDLLDDRDLRRESAEFLDLVHEGAAGGHGGDITTPSWQRARDFLNGLSRSRASAGFTPSETAAFVFSLKEPLFARLADDPVRDARSVLEASAAMSRLLDGLALLTSEQYQRGRESVIARQQREMIELSTPVVALWDGVLALPLIGTLDSERTQIVMENLLERIVETGSMIAIIDITGVPTVDTSVAQHLLKTVAAARLMGADCIISGIRPQIAQTIVHLGLTLGEVTTKATMADAIRVALDLSGQMIVPRTA